MDSLYENALCQDVGTGDSSMEILIPKKKDKLMGQSSKANGSGLDEYEDFDLLEGDIQKSIVNGIPSIDFSDSGLETSGIENWGVIGKVAKLDMNTDNKLRGHFARMAVYINLDM
ncbi:hypothetical protein Gohar_022352 [Gossypium harknessii]|uniref:Uncharacterized protein n=1 Tax=Gossypium harknessii TaxID=34285 RepID=A0A7J9ID72_9ROSI|nr:hypothetical protein [Gossypium harknessii]